MQVQKQPQLTSLPAPLRKVCVYQPSSEDPQAPGRKVREVGSLRVVIGVPGGPGMGTVPQRRVAGTTPNHGEDSLALRPSRSPRQHPPRARQGSPNGGQHGRGGMRGGRGGSSAGGGGRVEGGGDRDRDSRGGPPSKRARQDEKYGFGGHKTRLDTENDKRSSRDMGGFSLAAPARSE